jgi:4-azaleucine resistance transporter AzlC
MSTTVTSPQANVSTSTVTWSWPGIINGVRASVPVAIGIVVWGISVGVVARDAGFTDPGAILMSLLVYSGSAQIIALDMHQQGAGLIAILVSTMLVSLRYILMGVTMSGWFRSTPRWMFWPGIHYLSDQSWAMTINEMRSGRRDIGYFFGLNIGMLAYWVAGTAVGVSVGGMLGESVSGLHFASTAALVGILAGMKVRRRDVLPWIVAAVAAISAHALIEGTWYMIIGVAAGLGATLLTGDDDAQQ